MLAEDRHHRVGDGADACAGEREDDELQPVGQLEADHVAGADTKRHQAARGPVYALVEFAVADARRLRVAEAVRDHRCLLRTVVQRALEAGFDGLVAPEALRLHRDHAVGQQYGVKFHGVSSSFCPVQVKLGTLNAYALSVNGLLQMLLDAHM